MENNAGITTKKNSRKTLITVLVALVAAAVVLGGIMIALKLKAEKEEELRQSIINSGTFHTGITVGGVDVSGMTMEEASSALKTAEDKLTENVGFVVSDGENAVYAQDACDIAKNRLDVFAEVIGDILKSVEEDAPSYMPVYLTGEGVASMRGAKKYLSEQLGKNIEIITPKLPGFVKPDDCSKASLLVMADNLSKFDFGAFIKKLFNGGKK